MRNSRNAILPLKVIHFLTCFGNAIPAPFPVVSGSCVCGGLLRIGSALRAEFLEQREAPNGEKNGEGQVWKSGESEGRKE